jgi:hypothetical protein
MKNLLKLIGIIALVAVIGFSMAACDDGSKDDNGGGGDVLSYIPAESGLRGSVWNQNTNENTFVITFSNDGYSVVFANTNASSSETQPVTSYAKRPDGTHVIGADKAFTINGNTLTLGKNIYTRQP